MVTREVLIIVSSMLTSQRKVHNLREEKTVSACQGAVDVVTDERVMIFLRQPVI
jgi:hypothetical protein